MNNYYLLIYLSKHLKFKCKGCQFDFSYSPHKNVWEGFFNTKEEKFRLIFSADSRETALFTDNYRNPKKANVTTFFEDLKESLINEVSLSQGDRWITIGFESGHELLFKLFGNAPNIFLIRNGKITDAFKSPDRWIGEAKPQPRPPSPMPELDEEWSPRQVITKTDPTFPRPFAEPLITQNRLDKKSPKEIREFILEVVHQMKNEPEFRILEDGNLCLIGSDYIRSNDIKTFDSCNEAIRHAYYETSRERRLTKRIQSIKPRLKSAIDKTERSVQQLEKADKALERADKYENYGHILMAHAHMQLEHGEEKLTLPDFYNENEPVDIPVKSGLSVAENAQNYYERSAKAKTRVKESKRRLKELKSELHELTEINRSFHDLEKIYEFDDWLEDHRDDLNRLGVLSQNQKTDTLPFRKGTIGNYELWIGKNAKSNDALTSRAHKEDIWLHARGVSGSHVVIRMNNTKEYPPKEIVLKAASVAAWNSKARGSKLAPVIVTKRKYLSKPKGAPAGAVRVHQENVEMVQPQKLSVWTR